MLHINYEAYSPASCYSFCHGTCGAECLFEQVSSSTYYAPAYQIGLV